MRRLVAGSGVATRHAAHGEERDTDADRGRRDSAGNEDPPRVAQLAPGRIPDRRDNALERPVPGQPEGEPSLETGPGREGAERRADGRGGVDQRRQLRPNGWVASGQESIDGLIQAFGRRAGWQAGSPRNVRAFPILANTAGRPLLQACRQIAQRAVQEHPCGALRSVHHLPDLA
jgi:hypothetical protein